MIHNVVDFRAITARDVMVPLAKARTIPASATLEELLAQGAESGFERWPVVAETGEITGLVDIFDIALDWPAARTGGEFPEPHRPGEGKRARLRRAAKAARRPRHPRRRAQCGGEAGRHRELGGPGAEARGDEGRQVIGDE